MEIERLTKLSDIVVHSLGDLMIQLAPDSAKPTREYLQQILDLPNVYLFVAKIDNCIIGTFTLILYNIPTGMKVSVEDVVVHSDMRGKKLGEQMILFALEYAYQILNVKKIDLTSSPSRISANALYQKVGFKKRETNVYRYEFK